MLNHPLELFDTYVELLKRRNARSPQFEFSKYVYVPQEISERREVFKVPHSDFVTHFHREAGRLGEREEIAFHSRITTDELTYHIPMIDMGCEKIEPYAGDLISAFADFGASRFSIYNSGRSFHLYAHALLDGDKELVRFMGRILLLNLPKRERVIDERWVGHRLMAGYLTLRWTKNNPHYVALPTRYRVVDSTGVPS